MATTILLAAAGCGNTENSVTPNSPDGRDKFVKTWSATRASNNAGPYTYQLIIAKDPSDASRFTLTNFAGQNELLIGLYQANVFGQDTNYVINVLQQPISSQPDASVSGYIQYSTTGSSALVFSFTLNDATGSAFWSGTAYWQLSHFCAADSHYKSPCTQNAPAI